MMTMDMPKLSRRGMMGAGGAALALAAAPRALAADGPAISPLMQTVSAYMASAGNRTLPAEAAEKTKQHILDTLAAMISGSQLPPGKFDLKFAAAYAGAKTCTVVASNLLAGPMEAAMVNALLAHSDETDDTHPRSQSHPGASVVPSALAAGERFGISGARFVNAVALGYDIGTRFDMVLGKLQYMAKTHRSTHGLCANFGSAAAAGCAAGLDARQMRWLLSYAAQQASGLASWQRDIDHIEKAFDFAGMGARNGVTGALMVQAGGTGVDDVLSGTDNFFLAFEPLNDPKVLADGLGTVFEIVNTDFKKWTVGAPIQAPLDGMTAILQKTKFTPDQVKSIAVRVAADEATIVDNRVLPDICLQHMIAVMLVDGTVTFKSAHDVARMKDPAVLKQRAKVNLVHDPELEKLMPKRVAVVEVALNDGRVLSQRIEAVRGTAANPMSRDEVAAKATDLIAPVLGGQTCKKLIDAVFGLEKLAKVSDLRPLLQKT
jgi:2-methylcitrate dehydratase PrpD